MEHQRREGIPSVPKIGMLLRKGIWATGCLFLSLRFHNNIQAGRTFPERDIEHFLGPHLTRKSVPKDNSCCLSVKHEFTN